MTPAPLPSPARERTLRAQLEKRPTDSRLIIEMGDVLRAQGRVREAIVFLREATQRVSNHPGVMVAFSDALQAAGLHDESLRWLQRAASPDLGFADAMLKLGRIRMQQRQLNAASILFQRAMSIKPHDADAAFLHGMAELNRFQMADAIPSLQRATKLCAGRAEFHAALARAHELLGAFEAALASFDDALECNPDDDAALAGRVRCLIALRRETEACRAIDDANVDARSHPDLIDQLARLQLKRRDPSAAIDIVEDALERAGLHPSDRSVLQFAHARLLEADDRFEAAFDAYREANALYPQTFDRDAYRDTEARVRAVFDPRRLNQLPRSTNHSTRPVFIVGMPRSGTSLVEQILSAHPHMAGAGELESMGRMRAAFRRDSDSDHGYPEVIRDLTRERLDELASGYLAELTAIDADAVRVTDKMPANYRHLGIIWMLFPNARIIHCRRDPVDTCVSCYTTALPPSHGYANDFEDLAFVYAEYRQMMEFWTQTLDLEILDVDYESLVNDADRSIRRLVEFCDVPWDDACLSFFETDRPIATASVDQASRPIYRSSIGRAARFGAAIEPLREALEQNLASVAGR